MALYDSTMTTDSAVRAWCEISFGKKDLSVKFLDDRDRASKNALNWLLISLKKNTCSIQGLLRENLGPYLTSEDSTVRCRSIELLSTLLERLPTLILQENVAASMLTFFIERICGDFGSILPCLAAVRALLQNHHKSLFSVPLDITEKEEPIKIKRQHHNINKLFQIVDQIFGKLPLEVISLEEFSSSDKMTDEETSETNDHSGVAVHWSACSQVIRQQVFGLFEDFIQSMNLIVVNPIETQVLALFGERLFHPFIDVFEGEKDPRVLLTAMRIAVSLQCLMTPLSSSSVDNPIVKKRVLVDGREFCDVLVEVLSMYYPITFKPPPGDPFGITQEKLADELRECLVGKYAIAWGTLPHAMPLLLEHLDTSTTDENGTNVPVSPTQHIGRMESLEAFVMIADFFLTNQKHELFNEHVLPNLSILSEHLKLYILSDSNPIYSNTFSGMKQLTQLSQSSSSSSSSSSQEESDENLSESSKEAKKALKVMQSWMKLISSRIDSTCPPSYYHLRNPKEENKPIQPWCLSPEQLKRSDWSSFVTPLLNSFVTEVILDSQTLKGTAAGIGLCSLATSSPLALAMVMHTLTPTLLRDVQIDQNWRREKRGALELLGRFLLLSSSSSSSSLSVESDGVVDMSAVGCYSDAVYPYLAELVTLCTTLLQRALSQCVNEAGVVDIRMGSGMVEERKGTVQAALLILALSTTLHRFNIPLLSNVIRKDILNALLLSSFQQLDAPCFLSLQDKNISSLPSVSSSLSVFCPWKDFAVSLLCYASSSPQNIQLLHSDVMPPLVDCVRSTSTAIDYDDDNQSDDCNQQGLSALVVLTKLLQIDNITMNEDQKTTDSAMIDEEANNEKDFLPPLPPPPPSSYGTCLTSLMTFAGLSIHSSKRTDNARAWTIALLQSVSSIIKHDYRKEEGETSPMKGIIVVNALLNSSSMVETLNLVLEDKNESNNEMERKRSKVDKTFNSKSPFLVVLESVFSSKDDSGVLLSCCDIISSLVSYFHYEKDNVTFQCEFFLSLTPTMAGKHVQLLTYCLQAIPKTLMPLLINTIMNTGTSDVMTLNQGTVKLFLDDLLKLASTSAAECLCLVIQKLEKINEIELIQWLTHYMNSSVRTSENHYETFLWVCRGALSRTPSLPPKLWNQICSLLIELLTGDTDEMQPGIKLASLLDILVCPILNHEIVNKLWHQRFFSMVISSLLLNVSNITSSTRSSPTLGPEINKVACLMTIAHLTSKIKMVILKPYMLQISNILCEALQLAQEFENEMMTNKQTNQISNLLYSLSIEALIELLLAQSMLVNEKEDSQVDQDLLPISYHLLKHEKYLFDILPRLASTEGKLNQSKQIKMKRTLVKTRTPTSPSSSSSSSSSNSLKLPMVISSKTRAQSLVLIHLLSSSSSSSSSQKMNNHTLKTAFPKPVLVPYQKKMLQSLAPALDDSNKQVRRLAAGVRNEWAVIAL